MTISAIFQEVCEKNSVPCQFFASIDSTNEFAKSQAMIESNSICCYVANEQSAGKGRGTNSWLNPNAGTGLLVSFSFDLEKPAQAISGPLFGLALFRAIQNSFGIDDFWLKPPNDLYLHGLKCGGLLLESVQMGQKNRLIAGLGLNVLSAPTDLVASHLSQHKAYSEDCLRLFFTELLENFTQAALSAQAPHLTELERSDLIIAINLNTELSDKYVSLSPFGDLMTESKCTSWKDL